MLIAQAGKILADKSLDVMCETCEYNKMITNDRPREWSARNRNDIRELLEGSDPTIVVHIDNALLRSCIQISRRKIQT